VVEVDAEEVDFVEIDFDVNFEVDAEVDFVVAIDLDADFDDKADVEVEADFGVDDVTITSGSFSLLLFFLSFFVLRDFV
jgi:hypothetical protein